MAHIEIGRPEATEYSAYAKGYVDFAPELDIIAALEAQCQDTLKLLRTLDNTKAEYRYAPGKWSIKELVGHISDTERAFVFRAFHFARNIPGSIPGFDQDVAAGHAPYAAVPFDAIIDEYACIRRATLHLFRNLDRESWMRRGIANQNEVTVRALAYITLGHERHHRAILRERYLGNA
jgi:hypothetical protein